MSPIAASDLLVELTGMPSIVDYPPGSGYGPRTLDDYELVWLLQGDAQWTSAELTLDLSPGSLLLLRPGLHDSFRWDPAHTTRHAYVHFAMRHRSDADPAAWPLLRQLVPDDPLADLFRCLLWLGTTTPAGWEPRARDVLALLVAMHVSGPLPTDDAPPVPPVIERVVDYVREQWAVGPAQALPLAELAAAGAVSGVHLSRLFRHRFGIGPVGAIELLRMTRAEGLLLRSNLTVAAVAAEVGFADPYHFSRRFRAIYGIAPTAFRTLGTAAAPTSPAVDAGLAPLLQQLARPVGTRVAPSAAADPSLSWLRAEAGNPRPAGVPAHRPHHRGGARLAPFVHETRSQRVVFGPGRVADVADEVDRLGARRVLLIASTSSSTTASDVARSLGSRHGATFADVRQHVPEALAEQARSMAVTIGADAVVTIGGGSATGLGKAVGIAVSIPIVAVPTTYAGSETTDVYGITGEHKQTGRSPDALPRAVVYDPELTLALPLSVTVTSAFNALAHCVEALYPGRNPVAAVSAEAAIRAFAHALPTLIEQPGDLDGRSEALFAAYLAGLAFGAAGSALHHKLCHVLGGTFGLAHGDCNAVVLPYVAAYNAEAAPEAMRRVAAALREQLSPGISPGDAAGALRDLARRTGAPLSLAQIGMPATGLDLAAERAVAETGEANPRTPDVASVRDLLRHAYAGDEPAPMKTMSPG